MQAYLAFGALLMLVLLLICRVVQLRKQGIRAMRFGEMDKRDFLIVPFGLVLFCFLVVEVVGGPGRRLFQSAVLAWLGVSLCFAGLLLFLFALIAFGQSFRVGIDEERPGALITTGVFGFSRNPIYTAMLMVLSGIFLAMPNWIFLIYVLGAAWLIRRQIRLEETSLQKIYGVVYADYCRRVRRFL